MEPQQSPFNKHVRKSNVALEPLTNRVQKSILNFGIVRVHSIPDHHQYERDQKGKPIERLCLPFRVWVSDDAVQVKREQRQVRHDCEQNVYAGTIDDTRQRRS